LSDRPSRASSLLQWFWVHPLAKHRLL